MRHVLLEGHRVLVVDPEPAVRQLLASVLSEVCRISLASDGQEALAAASRHKVDIVLLDENLPGTVSREHLIRELRTFDSDLPIIVLSAHPSPEGPSDGSEVLSKDILKSDAGRARMLVQIVRAVSDRQRYREDAFRRRELQRNALVSTDFFVGRSPFAVRLREEIEHAARSDLNLLLTGETGVGKSLVARSVHLLAHRRGPRPFVVTEPAAVPPTLFESELFGHVRGAFTGATATQVGAFEAANGGTLFLDEIGDLPDGLQVKLLRAVETKSVRRVGDTREIDLDVRIIAATNREIEADVAAGRFRADLFHRLKEEHLHIPPLRERQEDILPLLEHFLTTLKPEQASRVEVQPDAADILLQYRWPGNVRELRTLARRLVGRSPQGKVTEKTLIAFLPARLDRGVESDLSPAERIRVFSQRVYLEELGKHGFSLRDTARALGIAYTTLRSRIRSLGLLELLRREREKRPRS